MPNPLHTRIEVDTADCWALREAMQQDAGSDASPEWLNALHGDFVTALRDAHIGDCTCVPCSCLKCHAEGYLGIDTIPGLANYLAYKVNVAFGRDNERSLDEAIVALEPQSSLWDSAEIRQAQEWLIGYRAALGEWLGHDDGAMRRPAEDLRALAIWIEQRQDLKQIERENEEYKRAVEQFHRDADASGEDVYAPEPRR